MIPYTNDQGYRDYRPSPVDSRPPSRRGWLWFVLVVGLIIVLDLGAAYWLRLGVSH